MKIYRTHGEGGRDGGRGGGGVQQKGVGLQADRWADVCLRWVPDRCVFWTCLLVVRLGTQE